MKRNLQLLIALLLLSTVLQNVNAQNQEEKKTFKNRIQRRGIIDYSAGRNFLKLSF